MWLLVAAAATAVLIPLAYCVGQWAWEKWFRLPWRTGKQHFSARLEADEEGALILLSHGQAHFIIDGEQNPGPLVVLVHGFIGSTAYLRFLAAALARSGRRVLRYDLYGRGLSVLPGRRVPHTASLFTGQLAELLFALGSKYGADQPVDLVGYSMGGGIAAHFTATFPERVRTVVFIAPCGLPSMRKSLPWYLPIVLRVPFLRYVMAQHLIDEQQRAVGYCGGDLVRWDDDDATVLYDAGWRDTETRRFKEYSEREHRRFRDPTAVDTLARSILLTLSHFPLGELAATFRRVAGHGVPVLILWGDEDRMVDSAGAAELHALMPSAKLVMLKGARHMVVVEDENAVISELLPFWETAGTGGAARGGEWRSGRSAEFQVWAQSERGF